MPNVTDLHDQLTESVDLTRDVISDINILTNIVTPVQATTGAFVAYKASQNALYQNLTTVEKVLTLASKLPVVGGPLSFVKLTAHTFVETLDNVDKTLKVVDPGIRHLDDTLGTISAGLFTAGLSANAALSVNGARIDVMDRLGDAGLLNGSTALSGHTLDNYNQLVEANDITQQVVDATQPLRDDLAALDFSLFGVFLGLLTEANDAISAANRVFEPFQEAMDALNEAIKPVTWALDAAQDVIDRVVTPVVDAVLEATGLQQVIDDLSDQLFGGLDVLGDLGDVAERLRVEIEGSDIATLATDFWDDLSSLFGAGSPIDFMEHLGVLTVGNDAGGENILGTNGDDTLIGTEGDDNIAPLEGDDEVDGQGGVDRALYLGRLEDYRVEFVPDGAGGEMLQVSSRADATAREGTDHLRNVELLRFSNAGFGDITLDDVRAFLYTEPGAPNLTGTEGNDWIFGDDANNVLSGAGGDDTIFGSRGDDILDGGAGDDLLLGGEGNDLLVGGPGADRVFGDAGDDDIVTRVDPGDTALDTLDGGAGHDALYIDGGLPLTADFATQAIDFGAPGVMGFANIEEVFGSASADTWLMADGAQILHTNGGNDTVLYAGEGDIVWAPDQWQPVTQDVPFVSFAQGGYHGVQIDAREGTGGDGRWEIMHRGLGPDGKPAGPEGWLYNVSVVEGTDFADTFYALGLSEGSIGTAPRYSYTHEGETFELDGNVFLGGGGTDVFFASETSSLFDGGTGYDIVNFNLDWTVAERLSEPGIQGFTIDLSRGLATRLGHSGANSSDIHLRNIEAVVGTRVDDHIIGNDEANYLFGYLGHDTIEGGGGNDYIDATQLIRGDLSGGAGNDLFALGAAENTTIDGGSGSDVLDVAPDPAFRLDVFYDPEAQGFESNPFENIAGWQIDLSLGTATSQFLESSARPGDVPFTYTTQLISIENALGSAFGDQISGSGADNLLVGRAGNDTIAGKAGDDALQGGEGDDVLGGGRGDDLLDGGVGADLVDGGKGNDQITAGSGDVITAGAGDDTISAFASNMNGTDLWVDGGAGVDELRVDGSATVSGASDGSGTVTWGDGTTLTYTGIEKLSVMPCFTPGTRIMTRDGERPVERLRPGDEVLTRDHGFQPLRWVGTRHLSEAELARAPRFRPIRIAPGALGGGLPRRALVVSPQHRVLWRAPEAELMFDDGEVLVAAVHLTGRPGIAPVEDGAVTYVHLLFDAHELVVSEGAWTESYQPGALSLEALAPGARAELLALFPELAAGTPAPFGAARPSLKRREARALV